jgi:hypothetical protein
MIDAESPHRATICRRVGSREFMKQEKESSLKDILLGAQDPLDPKVFLNFSSGFSRLGGPGRRQFEPSARRKKRISRPGNIFIWRCHWRF